VNNRKWGHQPIPQRLRNIKRGGGNEKDGEHKGRSIRKNGEGKPPASVTAPGVKTYEARLTRDSRKEGVKGKPNPKSNTITKQAPKGEKGA